MAINNYLTLTDIKAYMPSNEVVTKAPLWDSPVTTLCQAISRQIDTFTYREPGAYAASDVALLYYNGVPATATDFTTSILIDELAGAPTLVEISTSGSVNGFAPLAALDYFLWPYNAAHQGKPYLRIDLNTEDGACKAWPTKPRSVRVTGIFGYSLAVPADLQEACRLMVVRLLRKAQQNYIDTGIMMDTMQLTAAAKLDIDIKDMIAHYKRSRM